jgi:hypothetical protein
MLQKMAREQRHLCRVVLCLLWQCYGCYWRVCAVLDRGSSRRWGGGGGGRMGSVSDRHRAFHVVQPTTRLVTTSADPGPTCPRSTTVPSSLSSSSSAPCAWESFLRGGGSDPVVGEEASESKPALAAKALTLRVRLPDGSLQRIHLIDASQSETLTLASVLQSSALAVDTKDVAVTTSDQGVLDCSQTLSSLGLTHGSLLTLTEKHKKDAIRVNKPPSFSHTVPLGVEARFDPYPDLAKDYNAALQRRRRQGTSGTMSYSAVASLQSAMHTIEAQPTGSLHRVYMCRTAASRLATMSTSSSSSSSGQQGLRMGLLLGTIARERKHAKPKARTSLSSTVQGDEYCSVARVHALWEPPLLASTAHTSHDGTMDSESYPAASCAASLQRALSDESSVRRVARHLGLDVVGWIFTYRGDRSGADGLPVYGHDVAAGAQLQIELMKQRQKQQGSYKDEPDRAASTLSLLTLAMHAETGATEAFQLSDVAVQMVAEALFVPTWTATSSSGHDDSHGRYVTTRHPVLVDGKETNQLDSVLCLVNTALLSHEGWYAGADNSVKKKTGALTNKTRKALRKLLGTATNDGPDGQTDDSKLMDLLCDFGVLLALDELLSSSESELLCRSVQKWARGQKTTATIGESLKQRLVQVLGGA